MGNDVRQLFAYEDINQFSHRFPMKVLSLPAPVESTGATVYRCSLYYQRRHSRTIICYDLTFESVVTQQDLPTMLASMANTLTPGAATRTLTWQWMNRDCWQSTVQMKQRVPLSFHSWILRAWRSRRAGRQHQEEHSG